MDDLMLQAVARLAVALPLVALLAYLAVKYGLGRRGVKLQKRQHMRVVEQLPLSPKVLLSLVQVGNRYYLLAHQDGSTVVLAEMDEAPEKISGEGGGFDAAGLVSLWTKNRQREKNKHEG